MLTFNSPPPDKSRKSALTAAFTLIEMSLVLVVIGLVIGGILVGRDLIEAATIRAQISQIQKFQVAIATFRGKFGYLPGDIPANLVTQFGFTAAPTRSGAAADGDGNGELDGTNCCQAYSYGGGGENIYFWEDLSTNSSLIPGGFNSANGPMFAMTYTGGGTGVCNSIPTCSNYFPAAAMGNGSFIMVYSGLLPYPGTCCTQNLGNGPNFFSLNSAPPTNGNLPPLTVNQAYAIDKKMDDGMPTTGKVIAQYLGGGNNTRYGWSPNFGANTCFDTSSGVPAYSIQVYSNAFNCGLSFQFAI